LKFASVTNSGVVNAIRIAKLAALFHSGHQCIRCQPQNSQLLRKFFRRVSHRSEGLRGTLNLLAAIGENVVSMLKLIPLILLVPIMAFGRLFMERRITTPATIKEWILAWKMSDSS